MVELLGVVSGPIPPGQVIHVGAFPDTRIHGHPVAWTALPGPGPFRLEVPPGRWYLHGVAGPMDRHGFLTPLAWGSHGGIYGSGRPIETTETTLNPGPLHMVLSPLWRDLIHVPHHRQPALSDEQWQAVHAVIDALREDLACAVDGDLDRAAGLVRTRLSAVFKRATGLSIAEYRTRLRLETAKALLVQTNYDVLRIALEVGYGTAAQLGRMFQRYLGVSPGEFRRLAHQVAAQEVPADLLRRSMAGAVTAAAEPAGAATGSGAATNGASPAGTTRGPRPFPAPAGNAGGLVGTLVRAGRWTAGLAGLPLRGLPFVRRPAATIRGEVIYRGSQRGTAIYIGAFPGPFPDAYPAAWCALPGPGPFTLRSIPPGRHHILACYCRRRMLYPGDFHTSFAYGGFGDLDRTGSDPWNPVALLIRENDCIEGITIELVDGDRAAQYARPWRDAFLPDGR